MVTNRQGTVAPFSVAVRVGQGTSRGNFIFHTNKFVSREVSKNSTIRLHNIEERLPVFTEPVQSLIVGLLDIDAVDGIDIGPQGVRIYSNPDTNVDHIHDEVIRQLHRHVTGSNRVLEQSA